MSKPKTERELRKRIRSLIGEQIPLKFRGNQDIGNTWQDALEIPVSNKPTSDWDGIETSA